MKRMPILLGLVVALVVAATGATIAAPPSQTFQAPRIKVKESTSTNWSGYAIETNLNNPQNDVVSDVKGQWAVPVVQCGSANSYSSNWVGIDGYSDKTVEQTGTESDCSSGKPSYYAWYEMYPKMSRRANLAVKGGDVISAEVKFLGNNQFQLSLNNLTTGASFTTKQRSNGLRQSAEWIVEAPWSGGVLPLANFGTTSFSSISATLNGHTGTITDSQWQDDPITMVTSSGAVKAQPSSPSQGGSSFSVTWKGN